MKPASFEYYAPDSLDDALRLLSELGPDAKILAGGQSLLPTMNLRLARPATLIDINRIAALTEIRTHNGGLALGALVRHRQVERSELVREYCPILSEVMPLVAHAQIRSRGTLGGSLAHADPAAELPAVAALVEAELVARSIRGERVFSAEEFFLTYFTTTLEPDEMLVEVRIPKWPAGAGSSFQEVSRRHGDFALVGVAALLQLGSEGKITQARLSFTGAGATPMRTRGAEGLLLGETPSPDLFTAAAHRASEELQPESDIHGSAAYRLHVARGLTTKSLEIAMARAGGVV